MNLSDLFGYAIDIKTVSSDILGLTVGGLTFAGLASIFFVLAKLINIEFLTNKTYQGVISGILYLIRLCTFFLLDNSINVLLRDSMMAIEYFAAFIVILLASNMIKSFFPNNPSPMTSPYVYIFGTVGYVMFIINGLISSFGSIFLLTMILWSYLILNVVLADIFNKIIDLLGLSSTNYSSYIRSIVTDIVASIVWIATVIGLYTSGISGSVNIFKDITYVISFGASLFSISSQTKSDKSAMKSFLDGLPNLVSLLTKLVVVSYLSHMRWLDQGLIIIASVYLTGLWIYVYLQKIIDFLSNYFVIEEVIIVLREYIGNVVLILSLVGLFINGFFDHNIVSFLTIQGVLIGLYLSMYYVTNVGEYKTAFLGMYYKYLMIFINYASIVILLLYPLVTVFNLVISPEIVLILIASYYTSYQIAVHKFPPMIGINYPDPYADYNFEPTIISNVYNTASSLQNMLQYGVYPDQITYYNTLLTSMSSSSLLSNLLPSDQTKTYGQDIQTLKNVVSYIETNIDAINTYLGIVNGNPTQTGPKPRSAKEPSGLSDKLSSVNEIVTRYSSSMDNVYIALSERYLQISRYTGINSLIRDGIMLIVTMILSCFIGIVTDSPIGGLIGDEFLTILFALGRSILIVLITKNLASVIGTYVQSNYTSAVYDSAVILLIITAFLDVAVYNITGARYGDIYTITVACVTLASGSLSCYNLVTALSDTFTLIDGKTSTDPSLPPTTKRLLDSNDTNYWTTRLFFGSDKFAAKRFIRSLSDKSISTIDTIGVIVMQSGLLLLNFVVFFVSIILGNQTFVLNIPQLASIMFLIKKILFVLILIAYGLIVSIILITKNRLVLGLIFGSLILITGITLGALQINIVAFFDPISKLLSA